MEANKPTLREIVDEYSSIVRFSKSLGISRPSAYKYIDLFDRGIKEGIPGGVLKVFNTIMMTPKSGWRNYFNELYDNYLNQGEAMEMQDPVPKDIAETIDRLGMTEGQIDARIENALDVRKSLTELYGSDDDRVQRVERDLRNLQYTKDMIIRRENEIKFWPITEGDMDWITIEDDCGFTDLYNEWNIEHNPELKDQFKYSILKNTGGYTFVFDCPDGDSSDISVKIQVRLPERWSTIGVFRNHDSQNFIVIPKIFDYAYAHHFWYSIERRDEDGEIINYS
ncbi:MAG: hypothetical protein IKQ93_01800, partial [Candidatus Methanomethylophilaceae archaeon]|nr:hypothetical protein [Candidatus Methanomethylophilaceae archaeon]